MKRPLKVLFDACLWNETVTRDYYMVRKDIDWGGRNHHIAIAELQPRKLRGKNLAGSSEIFEAMKNVARLAESGRIRLYDTVELMFEWMGRPVGPWRNTEFDLFKNLTISRLKSPVERAVVFSGFDSNDDFMDQKRRWLQSIQEPRFLELKRVIDRKHWADAFHLWTAEVCELDCFLTLEKKFRNNLASQKKLTSTVEVLSPSDLAERFRFGYSIRRKWHSFAGGLLG
jgi:hypothetical protein